MTSPGLFRLAFVLYCAEAGFFFLAAPWLPVWESLAFSLPWGDARDFALNGWSRGAVAAFGLFHLAWMLHDIDLYLRRRGSGAIAPPSTAGGH